MSVRAPADLQLPPTPRSSPCSAGRPRARALQRQGCGQCFEQNQGGPVLAALPGTPCPGAAALASDSSRPARHSSGLSSVPTAAPAQPGPWAGDGAKAPVALPANPYPTVTPAGQKGNCSGENRGSRDKFVPFPGAGMARVGPAWRGGAWAASGHLLAWNTKAVHPHARGQHV